MRIDRSLVLFSLIFVVGCSGFGGPLPESAVNDSAEAVRLKAVLLEAQELAGSAIDITINRGTVLLEGFVETASQRSRAEDLVRESSELDEISNRIEVR